MRVKYNQDEIRVGADMPEVLDDMELLETVHGIESIAKVIENTTGVIASVQRKGVE
jgi:hypothetical protein